MNRTKWRCLVCGYITEGQRPPSHCPICGVPASMFQEMAAAPSAEKAGQK